MTAHFPIAPSGRGSFAGLRIAVPTWGAMAPTDVQSQHPPRPTREEFKSLLDGALSSDDLLHQPLSRSERRQLAVSRRLRKALYG